MSDKKYAAALGFAFVFAWVGFGFGDAVLCLLGAAVFWVAVAVREGEIDIADLQTRVTESTRRGDGSPIYTTKAKSSSSPTKRRVQ